MGVIGGIVAGIASFLGASGAVASAIGTAVNLGLAAFSIASSMGTAKAQRQAAERARLADIQRNAFRNFRQPLTPRRIVFGRCRVAGPLIFAHNRKQHGTHLLVALASHEVEEIESVWLLEHQLAFKRTAPNLGRVSGNYGKSVLIQVFRGTSGQDIGQAMRAAVDNRAGVNHISLDPLIVEEDDKFRGIAAIYAITRAWSQFFEGETPEFAAIVKGNNQIHDPRDDSTGYTANPALCIAWYLTEIMGFPWSSIDTAALITAADICDEGVDLKGGGAEARYECHGVITADMQHREAIDLLARSMAGTVRYAAGKWIISAGAVVAPSAAFSEAHCLAGYKLTFDPPDRSLPNAVRGSHVDVTSWQPRAYPQRQLAAAITAEGGPWWLDIDLPLTISSSMAQRIAKIELLRARARRRFSIELDLRGLAAQPGDVVTFSAPEIGINEAPFEVDAFSFHQLSTSNHQPILGTRLDLVEYSASTFAWTPADDELDGDAGTASPGGIGGKAPQDACFTESLLLLSIPGWYSATYTLQWDDPDTEEATLNFIRADLKVTVKWLHIDETTGEESEVTTVLTFTDDILPGTETLEHDFSTAAPNVGDTYVDHIIEFYLTAYYSDGTNSGKAPLGACALPPFTLTGHAMAGSFPSGNFLQDLEALELTWRLDDYFIADAGEGLFILYDDDGFPIAENPAGPEGTYTATSTGMSRYNSGAPWTYEVAFFEES